MSVSPLMESLAKFSTPELAAQRFVTVGDILSQKVGVPSQLATAVRDAHLEQWLQEEGASRIALVGGLATVKEMLEKEPDKAQRLLERPNRYPDGMYQYFPLARHWPMSKFFNSPKQLLERAAQGVAIMQGNIIFPGYGVVIRGLPMGGSSTRAQTWAKLHKEICMLYGIDEHTARFLYKIGNKALLTHTVELWNHIARLVERTNPVMGMTTSEVASQVMENARKEWGVLSPDERENSILFNQAVGPRMWLNDQTLTKDLFAMGHIDYAYFMT